MVVPCAPREVVLYALLMDREHLRWSLCLYIYTQTPSEGRMWLLMGRDGPNNTQTGPPARPFGLGLVLSFLVLGLGL